MPATMALRSQSAANSESGQSEPPMTPKDLLPVLVFALSAALASLDALRRFYLFTFAVPVARRLGLLREIGWIRAMAIVEDELHDHPRARSSPEAKQVLRRLRLLWSLLLWFFLFRIFFFLLGHLLR